MIQTPLKEIPCVILCGGKSSRMGEDKALLPFKEFDTLTQYQYERLKPYFKDVYLCAKNDKFDFLTDKSKIIYDISTDSSPMVALEAIFEKIDSEFVAIITVDTPLVLISTLEKLYFESKKYQITVAQTKRTHNLCGIFKKNLLKNVKSLLSDDIHKIGFLLKNASTKYVIFESEREFINLNTPDDYKESLSIIT